MSFDDDSALEILYDTDNREWNIYYLKPGYEEFRNCIPDHKFQVIVRRVEKEMKKTGKMSYPHNLASGNFLNTEIFRLFKKVIDKKLKMEILNYDSKKESEKE